MSRALALTARAFPLMSIVKRQPEAPGPAGLHTIRTHPVRADAGCRVMVAPTERPEDRSACRGRADDAGGGGAEAGGAVARGAQLGVEAVLVHLSLVDWLRQVDRLFQDLDRTR